LQPLQTEAFRVGSSIGRAAPKAFGVGSELKKSCSHYKLKLSGSVAQSVEQRPFKALVPGSSPGRPRFSMAWVYILRGGERYYIGATDNLERRLAEHKRGGNHTTHRFGELTLVAAKEMPSMAEARRLEIDLKKKKNSRLAIFALNS
jgi:predicted GIY-YIG superfamily endonuclease